VRIELLDHSGDKFHGMVKVFSVEDTRMTVDVPGRDSNDKVGHSATVKMNRSGISPPAFQHIELIRNL